MAKLIVRRLDVQNCWYILSYCHTSNLIAIFALGAMAMSASLPDHSRKSRQEIEHLYEEAKLYIGIGAFIVGLIFTYFIWSGIPIGEGLTKANYNYVQAGVLWIYYLCWIAGAPFDAYWQKWVFQASKTAVKVRVESVLLVIVLVVSAIAFLGLRHYQFWFSLFLLLFVIINVAGWAWINHLTGPAVISSSESYKDERDYAGLVELEIVNNYMNGSWQVWRFGGMVSILTLLFAISASTSVRGQIVVGISNVLARIPSAASIGFEALSSLLPVVLLSVFIVFAEGVIWYKRIQMRAGIQAIEALVNDYELFPVVRPI